jgi:hypothetical protein
MARDDQTKTIPQAVQYAPLPSLPDTVDALIDQLERAFPHASPRPEESHSELLWRGGQRSVVDLLVHLRRQRDEGDLAYS